MKEHLSVDNVLHGHLCLADSNLLKEVVDRQGIEVSRILDQLMNNVVKLTSSMTLPTGGSEEQKIGDPNRTYTAGLVLKLALYFYDSNVS